MTHTVKLERRVAGAAHPYSTTRHRARCTCGWRTEWTDRETVDDQKRDHLDAAHAAGEAVTGAARTRPAP